MTIYNYFSISAFVSLLGIPIGITSSAMELKICRIAVEIKKDTSIIPKNKKKHDKIEIYINLNLKE